MTHIEQAIREAIDTGYGSQYEYDRANEKEVQQRKFLDPLFWQALGKARGWEDHRCEQCHDVFPEYHNGCVRCGKSIRPDPFNRYHWHRLIDHLAEGKSAEDFFANL